MAEPSDKRLVAPKSSTGLRGRGSEHAIGEGCSTHPMQAQGVPEYKCLSTAESNTMLRMSSLPRWAHPFPRSLSLHTLVIERSRVSSQQTKYRQQILLPFSGSSRRVRAHSSCRVREHSGAKSAICVCPHRQIKSPLKKSTNKPTVLYVSNTFRFTHTHKPSHP
jgi:hypothetical protein